MKDVLVISIFMNYGQHFWSILMLWKCSINKIELSVRMWSLRAGAVPWAPLPPGSVSASAGLVCVKSCCCASSLPRTRQGWSGRTEPNTASSCEELPRLTVSSQTNMCVIHSASSNICTFIQIKRLHQMSLMHFKLWEFWGSPAQKDETNHFKPWRCATDNPYLSVRLNEMNFFHALFSDERE